MNIKKEIYEKFYLIFQEMFVDVEFPGDSWKETTKRKSSPLHWEQKPKYKEADLKYGIKKRDHSDRPLAEVLTNKEARYYYRFKTDYVTYNVDFKEMPDDILINTLKWVGAALGVAFINEHGLHESEVAQILFQFFWERFDPTLLELKPELNVFDVIVKRNSEKRQYDLLAKNNVLSREQQSERLTEINIRLLKLREQMLENDIVYENIKKESLEIQENIQLILEIIKLYFSAISEKDYKTAFDLWHPDVRLGRWKNKIDKFSPSYKSIVSVENIHIFDVQIKTQENEPFTAFCYVFCEEETKVFFDHKIRFLRHLPMSQLENYVDLLLDFYQKSKESSINDFIHEYSIIGITDERLSRFLHMRFDENEIKKILPVETVEKIPRLFRIRMENWDYRWFIDHIGEVFTNYQ